MFVWFVRGFLYPSSQKHHLDDRRRKSAVESLTRSLLQANDSRAVLHRFPAASGWNCWLLPPLFLLCIRGRSCSGHRMSVDRCLCQVKDLERHTKRQKQGENGSNRDLKTVRNQQGGGGAANPIGAP